jgi:two-component system nitrogen regulation sensor histidine kinase NtrY
VKKLFRNRIFLFVGTIVLLGTAQLFHSLKREDPSGDVRRIEKVLHQKEIRIHTELNLLSAKAAKLSYNLLFAQRPDYYNTLFKDEGLALLIYDSDTLKFWSDNSVAVENYMKEVCLDDRMARLKNGWFEVVKQPLSSSRTAVGLIHIKSDYPYQNHYLVNAFQKDFNIPSGTRLQVNDYKPQTPVVRNERGDYLFSIHPPAVNSPDERGIGWIQLLLNTAGLLLFVLFLKMECETLIPRFGQAVSMGIFMLLLVGLRFLTIEIHFPTSFYDSTLFGPLYYGDARSEWLPSLGDFLWNAVLIFYLSFYISRHWRIALPSYPKGNTAVRVITFFLFLSLFWFSWLIDGLFKGLIHNSEIVFNVNEFFSLNIYSVLGIIIIGFLLFAFFLYTDTVLNYQVSANLSIREMSFLFIPAAAIHIIICHLTGLLDLVAVLWAVLLILVVAFIKYRSPRSYSFFGSIILVMILSMYSVHTFLKHTRQKENDNRKVYAEKLATEQDPIAEHLYTEIEPQILDDSLLMHYLDNPKTYTDFEKRLTQRYFSGYWEKYDIHITYFDTACNAVIRPRKQSPDNLSYFDDLIGRSGQETFSNNLYYLQNLSGKISYLAKIPIKRSEDDSATGHLIISLESKFISEEIGFPELLLDRDLGITQQIANYSYAKYRNGKLINQYGRYHYPVVANSYAPFKDVFAFTVIDGFNHLIHRPDANTLILISKQDPGLLGDITTFSYLFAFYSLLLLLLLFFKQLLFTEFSVSSLSFKARIQSILVFIVLASLALFGFGTVFYIRQQYEAKNTENITEKLQSVLVEVDTRFEVEELDRNYKDYASYILKKLSNIFFTDINLYAANGNLYASSRPEVFDEGLASKKMNPEAYFQMAVKKKSEFVHDENIGNLNYLSAYIPFKNKNGKEIAFINLPYFAKQSELQKEISTFLVALINIYVLLFALSIIVAILISNYLTRPLKLIEDKMSRVKLGKANELIEWKQHDEIGSLISEYNRMIEELSRSAELLAKSERESAWREMAKQVAHEIKNPLTPMKLSIQHLQRLIDDKSPDLENRIRKLSQTLIGQIDTLSTIASEFSSFAQMPHAVSERINLEQVIQSSKELFKDTPDLDILFSKETEPDVCVLADKEQLIRVFNNLIKNAIQAIPEDQQGRIRISLTREKPFLVVRIEDNGSGISEELLEKIFVPNFTTKTGGMGLGLAMVRNILETFGGKITCETKLGEGSSFSVYLPECD